MAKHLTPAEKAAIVARYVETANGREVAREFGLPEVTVRRVIQRAQLAQKDALHARAVATAIRKARKLLAANVEMVSRYLAKHAGVDGVPDLEPKDVSALLNAQSNVSAKLMEVEERLEAKRMARLSRDLKRRERKIADLKIANGGAEQHEHKLVGDPGARLAEILAGAIEVARPDDKK